jgi:hypothetical protein
MQPNRPSAAWFSSKKLIAPRSPPAGCMLHRPPEKRIRFRGVCGICQRCRPASRTWWAWERICRPSSGERLGGRSPTRSSSSMASGGVRHVGCAGLRNSCPSGRPAAASPRAVHRRFLGAFFARTTDMYNRHVQPTRTTDTYNRHVQPTRWQSRFTRDHVTASADPSVAATAVRPSLGGGRLGPKSPPRSRQ